MKESGVPSSRQAQGHIGPLLVKDKEPVPELGQAMAIPSKRGGGLGGPLGRWEDHAQNSAFSELFCENSGTFPLL